MKLLFTDLDGTLLNDDKSISQKNLDAIKSAAKKEILTVITTGRSLSSALPYIHMLAQVQTFCYAITYNGGMIYDASGDQVLVRKTLPLPYVKYIFQQAESFGLHCQTYENGRVLALRDSEELREYAAHSRMEVVIDPLLIEHLKDEPVKVLTSCLKDRSLHERYRRALFPWAQGRISVFFSNEHYLEHVPEGTSKGAAMNWLCQYLKVSPDHTMAVGDAENDIPMLQAAHTGICMSNGTEQVKKIADFITCKDNNHDGVGEVLEKFIENL